MRTTFFAAITFFLLLTSVGAVERGEYAQFLTVPETTIETALKAQIGFGRLDDRIVDGSPITTYFGVDYALAPDWGVTIGLPLAGTISDGNDDFGVGNITLGSKYVTTKKEFKLGAGANVAFPTSQSGSGIGVFTRNYAQYARDFMFFSPYLVGSFTRNRLTLTADFGTDIWLNTDEGANGADRVENSVFYDLGVAVKPKRNLWATIELGGYSTTSFSSAHTGLFIAPGVRYQDDDYSVGFHLTAPLRTPERDIIDFMGVFDLRMFF